MNHSAKQLLEKAVYAHQDKNYTKAFAIFYKLATADHIDNQITVAIDVKKYALEMLAFMYAHAQGTEMDLEKSIYWDMQAIEFGSMTSLTNIAITYRMMGNIIQARLWFEKAIDSGDIEACLPLAKLYMVSDKETDTIKNLLNKIIESHKHSKFIAQHVSFESFKEAQEILNNIDS